MKNICYYQSPIGVLCLEEEQHHIVGMYLTNQLEHNQEISPLLQQAIQQLDEYFKGERKEFDLPLQPSGTEFQKKVWQALQQIPYGETRSYGEIAQMIGNPKACRAVGGANNKNPIMIVIPCHRVIGANGAMVGFGCGINIKECLLDLERKNR